jgi:entericidin B
MRLAAILALLMALTACETVKGAGRDIEKAGDAITDTSTEVQQEL